MNDERIYNKIANEISELVEAGVFPTGSRLPTERDLAKRFGTSRSCIREAKIALQMQGLIGTKVGTSSKILPRKTITPNSLQSRSWLELTEAGAVFEGESAALAAPIISDEAIKELENYIAIMCATVKSDMSVGAALAAFHNTIAQATKNQVIIFVIGNIWKMRTEASELSKFCESVSEKDSDYLKRKHVEIVEALKNRDSTAARTAVREHYIALIKILLSESEAQSYQAIKRKASEARSRFLLSKSLS